MLNRMVYDDYFKDKPPRNVKREVQPKLVEKHGKATMWRHCYE